MFPPSRQFACWQDGLTETGEIIPQNPACAAAVAQSGTTPLYNWFADLNSSSDGGTVGTIPDGRICDGGAGGPFDFAPYNAMRDDWRSWSLVCAVAPTSDQDRVMGAPIPIFAGLRYSAECRRGASRDEEFVRPPLIGLERGPALSFISPKGHHW